MLASTPKVDFYAMVGGAAEKCIAGAPDNGFGAEPAPDSVFRLFFAKTNHRRGGFIENIWMKNVKAGKMQRVLEVDTDVLYQWRDLVPTYQDSITFINGLYMDSVTCDRTEAVYDLKGDARLPIKNVEIRNVTVGEVTKFVKNVVNAENVVEENIIYKEKQDKQ